MSATLSFMRSRPNGSGLVYWDVEGTGSYSADCEHGRELAAEFLDFIGKQPTNGNATLLGCIVIDMMASGASSGLVVGFMGIVNQYAMATAHLLAGEFRIPGATLQAAT